MMGILNFFLVIALVIISVVVFVFVAVIGKIRFLIRQIRGYHKSGNTGSYTYSRSSSANDSQGGEQISGTQHSQKKKIIPADEGEYVEFEEIP